MVVEKKDSKNLHLLFFYHTFGAIFLYRNNQNIEEYGYVQDNGGAYHLCFHINDSGEKHFVRDIIKFISTKTKFSSECFKLNDNNEEHLYNILSSLIMIFYIDTHSFHNKTVYFSKYIYPIQRI